MTSFEDHQQSLIVFPRELRARANRVLDAQTLRDRNDAVVRFGLDCMKHLSALALAGYRSEGIHTPDAAVEEALAAMRGGDPRGAINRSTAGTWKELFVRAERATSTGSLFDRKAYAKLKLREVFEFELLIESLNHAVGMSAAEVGRLTTMRLDRSQPGERRSWFVCWDLLVSYRNHCAHDDVYHWLDLSDFYEVATPLLEGAVVATFLHPSIIEVLEAAPIWRLTRVQRDGGVWVHSFIHEPLGMNLRQPPVILPYSLLDRWSTPEWRAETGSDFVVRTNDDSPPDLLLFHDLLSGPLPQSMATHALQKVDDGAVAADSPADHEHESAAPDAVVTLESRATLPPTRERESPDAGLQHLAAEPEEPATATTEAKPGRAERQLGKPGATETPEDKQFTPPADPENDYLRDLPAAVRPAVRNFLRDATEAGGQVRLEEFPRIEVASGGRPRLLISLSRAAWYVQLGQVPGMSTQWADEAREEFRCLDRVTSNPDYVSFAWSESPATEANVFLAIALNYLRQISRVPDPVRPRRLHEAMRELLEGAPNAKLGFPDLAAQINVQGLYSRKDGQPVSASQVQARARKYPNLFIVQDGVIRLRS